MRTTAHGRVYSSSFFIYTKRSKKNGLKLVSFDECGEVNGYPEIPATLVLVFKRE